MSGYEELLALADTAMACDCGDWDGHPGDCAIFAGRVTLRATAVKALVEEVLALRGKVAELTEDCDAVNERNAFLRNQAEDHAQKLPQALAERDVLRGKVERVEALADEDARARAECAQSDECDCSYKDCYEHGMWHNCTHSPWLAIRAALDGPA